MKTKPCFLVFSDDWGEHPSSCQHIFRYIARTHDVLWVNTIGMRNPRFCLRDARKVVLKVGKMLKPHLRNTSSSVSGQIQVCQPPMLPYSNFFLVRRINKRLVLRTLQRRIENLHLQNPIIVATVPNACDFVGGLPAARRVYYCVDDFSEWPGLEKKLILDMEQDLIRHADRCIATSQALYEKLAAAGKPTALLPHGVDLDLFQQEVVHEHPILSGIPKPRIGYFGLFDDRTDKKIMAEAARALPEVSFVITGAVETDTSSLEQLPNIYFTGPVPYAELPALLHGWDACMLFYKINALTNAIQPLKLKEYLAAGKPVLATPIAEAVKLRKYLVLCASAEDVASWFKQHWGRFPETENGAACRAFLRNESWRNKSKQFLRLVVHESFPASLTNK